ELGALRNFDVLEDRWVPFHKTWPCERVASEGSSVPRGRPLEYAPSVVVTVVSAPAIRPHVMRGPAEAGNRRVGPIIGFEVVVVVTTTPGSMAEWFPMRTGVIRDSAVQLPPSQHRCRDPSVVLEKWKLVNIIHSKRMADVEDGIAAVEPRH